MTGSDAIGTLSGHTLRLHSRGSSGYTYMETLTISADGSSWTGTLSDSNGTSGTDTGIRLDKPSVPPPAGRNPADAIGRVYEIKGRAFIQQGKNGPIRLLKKEDQIFVGDHIYTDENSVAAIELLIGGRIGMKKGTEIVVINEGEVAGIDPTTGNSVRSP